ncbi:MAG: hypothetical protein JWN32_3276 [Solirubrobacterales bacterium]|nr:hypothetical protein [Solirubrobacterales bacterium]
MEKRSIRDQIEELVDEEHRLWRSADEGHGLSGEDHERLGHVRQELDHAYDVLRRRRAGAPDDPVRGVPTPPNDIDDLPTDEPPHLERGGLRENVPAPDPGINPNAP